MRVLAELVVYCFPDSGPRQDLQEVHLSDHKDKPCSCSYQAAIIPAFAVLLLIFLIFKIDRTSAVLDIFHFIVTVCYTR